MSSGFKLGMQPLTYGLSWPESLAAAQAVDDLGYDYLWGHDHLYSTGGDPFQPFFEGWTTLAAWSGRNPEGLRKGTGHKRIANRK